MDTISMALVQEDQQIAEERQENTMSHACVTLMKTQLALVSETKLQTIPCA